MKIKRATSQYEDWLGKQLKVVQADIEQKHQNMASDPFIFLRASYYRWAQTLPNVCAQLVKAPTVLAIGDLHIENFGTWRDAEGRLIWGINDFDESYRLPYTNDLIRLASSADLATESKHLHISFGDACKAILEGYEQNLTSGGKPFVLGEHHSDLRKMALGVLRDPVHFWQKLDSQTGAISKKAIPKEALSLLLAALPEGVENPRFFARQAGQGSLGRQRFVVIADHEGGRIARECKALDPSACAWAEGSRIKKTFYQDMLTNAVRCDDPFVAVIRAWVLRRLAPDCSKIDISSLPQQRDERVLLHAMGAELANIHLGSKGAARLITRHLDKSPKGWLPEAAKDMSAAIRKDWKDWREKHDI